jgi:hypothetical protein
VTKGDQKFWVTQVGDQMFWAIKKKINH